ncbi:MAG: alpha/beta hydrolase [Coleofasciculus sp. C1-SOL-03]|uniref:alpha/beta fold hydrolase n=1 Tax=Coleofasciculus sp. C1-SOL-03 TaxID=3069522 RepID=UPI0032F55BE2
MFANFLPAQIQQLTESTSIDLAQAITRQDILTPLNPQPIATTYVHQGKGGTPILLLHGFDSSIFEFRRLFPKLAEYQETWAVDLLGFGFTNRISQITFNASAITTHLYYFWKTLIQVPVILVGASMGGTAAIDFTLTYSQAVEKLVLLDSAGFTSPPPIGKFLFPPLDYWAVEFLRRPQVREKISKNAYFDPTFVSADALLCAALHLDMPGWHRALISFTKSGGYPPIAQKLSKIQQPTLILWGKDDRILGTKYAHKFEAAIPNSQLLWIDDCGHVPHLEKPEITAEYIQQFS